MITTFSYDDPPPGIRTHGGRRVGGDGGDLAPPTVDAITIDLTELFSGTPTNETSRTVERHTENMRTEQLADARLPRLADEVEATGEPVVLVREGHEDVMLVSAADVAAYREWMSHRETVELMNDPEAQREIAEAKAAYARGEFITGEEARALYGLPPLHDRS